MYVEIYKDKIETEKRVTHQGKAIVIKFTHFPNYVRRSHFHGLPVVVGRTDADVVIGKTPFHAEARCWALEPFDIGRGEYVATGRLMKKIGLPTGLADQLQEVKHAES